MSSRLFKYFDTLETFTSKKISAIEDNTAYLNGNLTVVGTPEILWEDICFIEAEQIVWTHGTIFVNNSYYVSKNELTSASYVKSSALSTYVSYAFLSSQSYVKSSDITSLLEGDFITYDYLSNQAYLTSSGLIDYVTKTELSNQSYLTAVPNNYPTYAAISAMGYITEHQSLDNYTTKKDLDDITYIVSQSIEEAVENYDNAYTWFNNVVTSNNAALTNAYSYYNNSINQTYGYFINMELICAQAISEFDSNLNDNYISQTSLSNNSYAGYSYVYNAYAYVVSKINLLEMSSGLPTVTSSDNGKILMVVNGSWSLVTPVTLYSGNATPSNSNGNNGDLYIQS